MVTSKRMLEMLALIVMTFLLVGLWSVSVWAQTRPALIRDVDNEDRQTLFHYSWTDIIPDIYASTSQCPIPAVPAGKRLIIDHVSVMATLGSDQIPLIKIFDMFEEQVHYIDMSYKGVASDKSRWFASQPIKMRFPPNGRVCFYFGRVGGATGEVRAYIEISGYQMDSP